jgi:hypothetical protein
MNDDVPARDAEGRTSLYAEKTAQSLYAQLGFIHPVPKLSSSLSRDSLGSYFAGRCNDYVPVKMCHPL